ncbi:mobilization protein [Campylobacter devanensis]|uniref:mobilization protein n=1 Tax=Campylobacter devanensis TaxID=3161138 RepID=UPI001F3283D2|nr:mobilization protein [Campylobacter sp. P0106]
MSQISSINFKKSVDFQVFHNSTVRPNYAIGGELIANRKGYEALKLKEQIVNQAIETYKSRTKRAFQAKSYEWSAVCNIKEDTTMADLERLAEHFEQKYGFQCYQIAIHRDEGHINDNGEKEINHHAHLEFITLDKNTGRNRQRDLKPEILRQIQTEVAEILGMERGVDKKISKRERIEPRKYAQMKEQERKNTRKLKQELEAKDNVIQDLNQELEAKDQELEDEKLSKKRLKEQIEAERKAMIEENQRLKEAFQDLLYIAEDYKKLRALNEKQNITIDELNAEIEQIKKEAREREAQKNQEIQDLKADKQRFNELLEQDPALNKAYNQALEALKNREKTSNNAELNENLAKQAKFCLDNIIKDDEPLCQNTAKIEHSEQDQKNNYDDLGIDKIIIYKNEDKTQEDNKPKIRKHR